MSSVRPGASSASTTLLLSLSLSLLRLVSAWNRAFERGGRTTVCRRGENARSAGLVASRGVV